MTHSFEIYMIRSEFVGVLFSDTKVITTLKGKDRGTLEAVMNAWVCSQSGNSWFAPRTNALPNSAHLTWAGIERRKVLRSG